MRRTNGQAQKRRAAVSPQNHSRLKNGTPAPQEVQDVGPGLWTATVEEWAVAVKEPHTTRKDTGQWQAVDNLVWG